MQAWTLWAFETIVTSSEVVEDSSNGTSKGCGLKIYVDPILIIGTDGGQASIMVSMGHEDSVSSEGDETNRVMVDCSMSGLDSGDR